MVVVFKFIIGIIICMLFQFFYLSLRQYQIEEKDEQGNVYGKYGFLDDKGVFRETKYSVKKNQGFRVL